MAQRYLIDDAELLLSWPTLDPTVPLARRDYYREYAECFIDPAQWGACAHYAHAAATAHVAVLGGDPENDTGLGGGIGSSMSVGPASVTETTPEASSDQWNWASTAPGREFARLRAARGTLSFLVQRVRTVSNQLGVVRR